MRPGVRGRRSGRTSWDVVLGRRRRWDVVLGRGCRASGCAGAASPRGVVEDVAAAAARGARRVVGAAADDVVGRCCVGGVSVIGRGRDTKLPRPCWCVRGTLRHDTTRRALVVVHRVKTLMATKLNNGAVHRRGAALMHFAWDPPS